MSEATGPDSPSHRPNRAERRALAKASAGAGAGGQVVTPQPHGAYAFVRPLMESRVELLSTFVIDGALLTGAALVRFGALWVLHQLGDAESLGWPILVLEGILDFGIVGTAAIITAFDLIKRIRMSYRELLA